MAGIIGSFWPSQRDIPMDAVARSLEAMVVRGRLAAWGAVDGHGHTILKSENLPASSKAHSQKRASTFSTSLTLGVRNSEPLRQCYFHDSNTGICVFIDGVVDNINKIVGNLSKDPTSKMRNALPQQIATAYRALGESCFEIFDGGYAILVVDFKKSMLFLARDFCGRKPMYYHVSSSFVFGSDLRALVAMSRNTPVISVKNLIAHLQGTFGEGDPQTLLDGYRQLAPGELLGLRLTAPLTPSVRTTWRYPKQRDSQRTFAESVDHIRSLLESDVSQHKHHHCGYALSGGLDSAAIVASGRRIVGESAKLETFSFAVADGLMPSVWNESRAAEQMAETVGAIHREVYLDAREIPDAFTRAISESDLPLVSPVTFAQRKLFLIARETGVTAFYGGHGPDYLLGGSFAHLVYVIRSMVSRYDFARALTRARRASRREAWSLIGVARSVARLSLPLPSGRLKFRFHKSLPKGVSVRFRTLTSALERGDSQLATMSDLIAQQVFRTMLPTALRIEERNANATNLVCLYPYLSKEFVEFVFTLPEDFLIDDEGMLKAPLRAAVRVDLPRSIIERSNRVGFPIPVHRWLLDNNDQFHDYYTAAATLPICDRRAFDALKASAMGGNISDCMLLWRWLGLASWIEKIGADIA